MRFDVVVVGGGTAGCVLTARLSENRDRRVCLVEAGPDYGPLVDGRWPAEILDPGELAFTHAWEPGADDGRTLGGRILGGSSAMNACMVLAGSPADYDEWGGRWSYDELRPYLDHAARAFRTHVENDRVSPFESAFLDAAATAGHALLADPSNPATPVGVAPAPRNVDEGRRWSAAFAYLEDARGRPNLTILADTIVDRVLLDGKKARGASTASGERIEAPLVFLAAGAYFSPAILMRSGVGPAGALGALGIEVVEELPVGERLLDHCGTDVSFDLAPAGNEQVAAHARTAGAFSVHAVVKAASSACDPGSWDLHLVPWVSATDRDGEFRATIIVFHMKPLSSGSVRLRSRDPGDVPLVDRGFLTREEDTVPLLEGIELAREVAATEPLASLLGRELLPGDRDPLAYLRETIRNYFHPAGTCPLGTVVDTHARVFGIDGLYVADASFMPTIPRANTNLTTAAIAERIAADFG